VDERLKVVRIDMAGNYDPLFNLPSGTEDIAYFFKTMRPKDPSHPGSFYAHHADSTTTANREPSDRKGKGQELQQRSGKTVYMDPNHVKAMAGIYQNTEMATRLVPLMKDGKYIGGVALQLMEDYGPKKAGSTIVQAPYKTKPEVGLNPVEIGGSAESPKGSSGKNIHFGNAITEVHPRPTRLGTAGKLGVAGALAGAATASNAAELGESASGLLPPFLQALTYGKGAGEGEDAELAYKRRKEQADALGAGNRGLGYDPRKPFNPVALPEDYRSGGRVRMI